MTISFFWIIRQPVKVICDRRFGTTYRPHLQASIGSGKSELQPRTELFSVTGLAITVRNDSRDLNRTDIKSMVSHPRSDNEKNLPRQFVTNCCHITLVVYGVRTWNHPSPADTCSIYTSLSYSLLRLHTSRHPSCKNKYSIVLLNSSGG